MPLERADLQIIALELATLSHDIEAVGASLCGDPALATEHCASLQSIDLIAQRQRALADLLLADSREDGLGHCGLDQITALFDQEAPETLS